MCKVIAIFTTSAKKGSFIVILILLAKSFLFLFMLTKPIPKSASFWFWLYDWNNVRKFKLWMNFIPGRLAPQHYFQQLQNTLHKTFFSVAVRDGRVWIICGNFPFHRQAWIWKVTSHQQLLLFSDWFRRPFIEQRDSNRPENWGH